jgi:phosphoribosyl-ATP pyrophosphohydrolase/phosphoribosyl-AMP cyclohydrolase
MKEEYRPLIVCDESGRFLFLAYTDRTGYMKSLEHGTLRAVHPESDQLLPNGSEGVLQRMEDRGTYYYAEVSLASFIPGDTHGDILSPSKATGEVGVSSSPPAGPSAPEEHLRALLELIKNRNRSRPCNSYTGNLFDAGIEEIRKKLGIEAVELVLSRTRENTIVEAADLLFHLLVLLEEENIEFTQVLEELSRRQLPFTTLPEG